jgi:glycosyltransferase involved in cell wall biosynthesis
MRILLVTNSFFISDGGSYTAISELSYALNKKKEIIAKIFHNNNNNNNIFNLNNYKIIINNFDIIHIFGIWNPFLGIIFYIAKKLGKNVIISPLGYLEPWSLEQSKIKKKIAWHLYQKKILETADRIHVTSQQELNSLKKLNLNNKNLFLLPHGNLEKIYLDLKRKEKKDNRDKIMLFFSRIHKKKGLLELIEAWNILKPKNWKLDITGPTTDINYKNIIKKKIYLYNLEKDIYFSEPIFDKYSKQLKILNSEVVVLPSKNENFAFSVCEAMSVGSVVLTSKETPWEEINQLQAGFCLNLNNTDDVINALKKIFNLKDQDFSKIRDNAKNYIKSKFDLESIIINKYIDLYKSLPS